MTSTSVHLCCVTDGRRQWRVVLTCWGIVDTRFNSGCAGEHAFVCAGAVVVLAVAFNWGSVYSPFNSPTTRSCLSISLSITPAWTCPPHGSHFSPWQSYQFLFSSDGVGFMCVIRRACVDRRRCWGVCWCGCCGTV